MVDAARAVLCGEEHENANLSIAVVDSANMQSLNRQYLDHDFPTDVLSFSLGETDGILHGEVIVCADVAADIAEENDWTVMDELLLYVIHGTLHFAGYDDKSEESRTEMRVREQHYLLQLNIGISNASNTRLTVSDSARSTKKL